MNINDVKKVCIVGGGLMGRQIALNTAIHGFDVYLTDSIGDVLLSVEKWANDYMKGRVEKGRMTEEQTVEILSRFHIVSKLEDAVEEAQLVIEAIIEDKETKMKFYKDVSELAPEDCILASNSSYMPSSLFKDNVKHPARLANLHYFNPALVLKLVEVVSGPHTANETVNFLVEFAKATGKIPIRVNKEIDGFVVNRILRGIRDEAYYLLEEGVASAQDIDLGVELGLSHPMGPFKLLDLTGIDLNYLSLEQRRRDSGVTPPGYKTSKKMYEKGEFGRKSGKGFYEYD